MACSPCIDAGYPDGDYAGQTDLEDEPRVIGDRVDIGADEFTPPTQVACFPPAEGTLPRTANNVIRIVFDKTICLPLDQPPVTIGPVCSDLDIADQFTFSVEAIDPSDSNTLDRVLECRENGSVLSDLTWYRIESKADFAVIAFSLDLFTLRGDADGSGKVVDADQEIVTEEFGEHCRHCRGDLDGSGRVLAADHDVVTGHIGNAMKEKLDCTKEGTTDAGDGNTDAGDPTDQPPADLEQDASQTDGVWEMADNGELPTGLDLEGEQDSGADPDNAQLPLPTSGATYEGSGSNSGGSGSEDVRRGTGDDLPENSSGSSRNQTYPPSGAMAPGCGTLVETQQLALMWTACWLGLGSIFALNRYRRIR
jgi:hypothetical protein